MDEVLSTMKQEGLYCHQDIQKSEACFTWHILLWQKIALKKKVTREEGRNDNSNGIEYIY